MDHYLSSSRLSKVTASANSKVCVRMSEHVNHSVDHSNRSGYSRGAIEPADLQKHGQYNLNQNQRQVDHDERTKLGRRTQRGARSPPWKMCLMCSINMRTPTDFLRHLRDKHCAREGGSYVCRYGLHGVCPTLPVDGVSDSDYECHVAKDHMHDEGFANRVKLAALSDPPTASAPSVVSNEQKWTVLSSVVNLPAVLNDPRKVRRETDFFTKTWGEGFVENAEIPSTPYVPRISRIHFEKYLRQVACKLKEQRRPSAAGCSSHDDDDDDSQCSSLATRNRDKANSELQQVPKMFFRSDFALENQDTFEAVLPWSQFKGQQSSKLLQEKLSHYLDMVEVQIARQISMRSTAFFSAMASHDRLQEDLLATSKAVCDLRDKINNIDNVLAKGSLQVMRLKISRVNYVKVYNKLKLMATVHQTQPTIQLLLSSSEFVGALDLISTTHEILTQELAGIQSFRHLSSQLIEMEKLIDKMLCEEFTRYTAKDLNRPLDDPSPTEEDKLSSVILGMMRQRKFSFLHVYRDETTSAIKAVIKQTVVEAVSEADTAEYDVTPSSLSEQMRLLNFTLWLELFNKVFINLMILLNRIEFTHGIMKKLVDTAAGKPSPEEGAVVNGAESGHREVNGGSPASTQAGDQYSDDGVEGCIEAGEMLPEGDFLIAPNEHVRLSTGLHDLLGLVCDYMHDRCLKLLIARGKDGFLERLSSSEFLTLSRTVEVFVSNCEEGCGRRSTSLIGGLQNQAVKFVSRFHDERKTKLSLILDSERWKQAEVPAELQDLLSAFSNGVISLDLLAKTDMGNGGARKVLDCVDMKGTKYAVVGTALMLLKMVAEYCQCVKDMPSATMDLLTRVVELLQMFNSRSCQLILGAGALQLVGLRTITTKNLALTSRCLQLVALYIPVVKDFFAERVSLKQQNLLKSFDKIFKDYNDHVQEISSKLVAIMDDSFRTCLSTWEVKAPVPSSCFREICKRIRKLYEAIADLLPPEQVKVLFTRLNASFKTRLKEQLIHLNVHNDGGPKHGLVTSDLVFYSEFIQSLDGLGDVVDNMADIWSWR